MWVTRHGPVFVIEHGSVMSLKWTAARTHRSSTTSSSTWTELRNWDEFKAALAKFGGPGQNFVYADVDGNIGYHATGQAAGPPAILRRCSGRRLSRAKTNGKVIFRSTNCRRPGIRTTALFVTANQNPFPADYPFILPAGFAALPFAPDPRHAAAGAGKLNRRTHSDPKGRVQRFPEFLGQQIVAAYIGAARKTRCYRLPSRCCGCGTARWIATGRSLLSRR